MLQKSCPGQVKNLDKHCPSNWKKLKFGSIFYPMLTFLHYFYLVEFLLPRGLFRGPDLLMEICLFSAQASEKDYLDLDENKTADLSPVPPNFGPRKHGVLYWPKQSKRICIFSFSNFINNTSSAPQAYCITSFFTSCAVSCCDYVMLLTQLFRGLRTSEM